VTDFTHDPHPLLDAAVFISTFPRPVGEIPTPKAACDLLVAGAPGPFPPPDVAFRKTVRDLLRHSGFKPTGRSKPASEYLANAVTDVPFLINVAADIGNAVSLHCGLPIGVVDADKAPPPYRIRLAGPGESYAFNPSGQVIDLQGLIVLCDAQGPCANPVKDAQRTKTDATTTRTVNVIWGSVALPSRCAQAFRWYQDLLASVGATVEVLAFPR
jgi:DNA/RNA-binding domain of Phe-tRNA-synthetase-like protein